VRSKKLPDSTSSLRNGYEGSYTTLAQPLAPEPLQEKRNRAVSMADTSPVLRRPTNEKATEKEESSLVSSDAMMAEKIPEGELTLDPVTGEKKERRISSSSSSEEDRGGCAGALRKKKKKKTGKGCGHRRFGEVTKEENKKLTARQWLLLSILSLATLTSSFAICLFPPFFPKVVSIY